MNKESYETIFLLCLIAAPNVVAFQGGERPTPPSPSNTVPARPVRRRVPLTRRGGSIDSEVSKFASVAIKVSPVGSLIWLDDRPIPGLTSDENTLLTKLKPGTYVLTIRHKGYADYVYAIDLKSGTKEVITVALEPLKGTLVVKPSVDGASIEIRSVDQKQVLGSYVGSIDGIGLPPADYEITVSKPGYKPKTRTFTLKADALVELELVIDPLHVPTSKAQAGVPAVSSVRTDGKDLLFRLVGASGDTRRTSGTMKVLVSRTGSTADIQGSLSGVPCEVVFVALENIDNWALTDLPAASNNWALIGARIRPQNAKRPVRFEINWITIQNSGDSGDEDERRASTASHVTTKAVVLHRVVPVVPVSARSARVKGLVKVSVVLDPNGNVKSANAFEGPMMLRQAAENAARGWKFKPATRNGESVESTEVLYFKFEH